ncbi:hypothetical protein AAG906_008043 [Vitis piasezkii]
MVIRSNAKHLTHDAIVARFDPYMYAFDGSYQNVTQAKVVLLLVADKKQMVAVDLNMYSFVMPDVPCQPNELTLLFVLAMIGVFIMKFMDNGPMGTLQIDRCGMVLGIQLGGKPTVNGIAAISWLRSGEIRLPLGQRASACEPSQPGEGRLAERQGLTPDLTISEPIFPTLVRAFYSRVTYGHGGPIVSTVRGVQIKLDPETICRILDIAPVGLRAFLIDSIMTGRRIGVGYVMMMHMLACLCESSTRVLPYGRFHTSVQGCGVDLSKERDFEAPSSYDTYDEQSLARMKFEKGPDGSWNRKVERPVPQPAVEEEAEIGEMEGGVAPREMMSIHDRV